MDASIDDAERLLRESRSEPRADFVRELEASLVTRVHRRDRIRVLAAGAALCASLIAVTLVLSVAGLLPFGAGGTRRVEAGGNCTTVVQARQERRPVLVVDSQGRITTRTQVVTVHKPVKRCR